MRMAKMMKKEKGAGGGMGGWGEGTVVKEMQGGDCRERDARRDTRRGLLGKGCKERYKEGTVGKGMQGEIQEGDGGERDARRDTRTGL